MPDRHLPRRRTVWPLWLAAALVLSLLSAGAVLAQESPSPEASPTGSPQATEEASPTGSPTEEASPTAAESPTGAESASPTLPATDTIGEPSGPPTSPVGLGLLALAILGLAIVAAGSTALARRR